MMKFDLYKELGLDPGREYTPEEVKAAYRRAAKRYHPDCGGDADAFWRVRYAYRVLSDPDLKDEYDATGDADPDRANTDTAYADAVSLILNAFEQVMGSIPIDEIPQTNLIQRTRAHIHKIEEKNARERQKAGASLGGVEEILGRVRYQGRQADVIKQMLEQKARALRRGRVALDRSDEVCAQALEILGAYEFRLDDPDEEDMETLRRIKARAKALRFGWPGSDSTTL